ncbi:hypothetical protein H5410_005164 [Solanum commersonii]|uniref:Uncharacterized protein n=1 Tax=Solanum commersonii TaxID=4109 RepID=A0A9J6A6E9_SOLCO|nr:hypothetical protein H5410_005164 [Solanum commersonii]
MVKLVSLMWNLGMLAALRRSMIPAQMVLLSKEDLVMVEVVVDIDVEVEVGDMVVMKLITVVANGMEVMVHMAAMLGSEVEVAVVEDEVGVPSVGKVVI